MEIELIRSRRKTLSLQVRVDGTVAVRAPLLTREKTIRNFVEKHMDWISAQQAKMEAAREVQSKIQPLSACELRSLAEQARTDLTARAEYFAPRIGVRYGRIAIRHQKSKWGSCSSKGNLNFNCLLMLAPEQVRNYVVVHELCHRLYMNHSEEFWNEVANIMPDYQEAKLWLRQHGRSIMMRNTSK